jgi:hypothetical protein
MRHRDSQITSLYLVTRPSAVSEAGDLVCGGSLRDVQLQFLGGLQAREVVAMFTDRDEAEARARQEIRDRDAAVAVTEQAAEAKEVRRQKRAREYFAQA